MGDSPNRAARSLGGESRLYRPLGMGHVGGRPAGSDSSANTYPGLPLGRGLELQLYRRHLRPWACMGWCGKDYLLLLAMRRRRGCPRNYRSRCSGATWWTPGGAYIEHARVAEVTGELLPAQPGLPGLVVVVVVVAPRRLTMSARHATPSSRPLTAARVEPA